MYADKEYVRKLYFLPNFAVTLNSSKIYNLLTHVKKIKERQLPSLLTGDFGWDATFWSTVLKPVSPDPGPTHPLTPEALPEIYSPRTLITWLLRHVNVSSFHVKVSEPY